MGTTTTDTVYVLVSFPSQWFYTKLFLVIDIRITCLCLHEYRFHYLHTQNFSQNTYCHDLCQYYIAIFIILVYYLLKQIYNMIQFDWPKTIMFKSRLTTPKQNIYRINISVANTQTATTQMWNSFIATILKNMPLEN